MEPEAYYRGCEAQFLRSAVALLFTVRVKFFEKDTCLSYKCSARHRSDKRGQYREALFTPCKAGWHPMISKRLC